MDLDLLVLYNQDNLHKPKIKDYQRIATERDYLLWQRIHGTPMFHVEGALELILRPKPVFPRFTIMVLDDEKQREAAIDKYGNKFTYVYNSELQALKRLEFKEETNKAIRSISHLNPYLPIVLYWW